MTARTVRTVATREQTLTPAEHAELLRQFLVSRPDMRTALQMIGRRKYAPSDQDNALFLESLLEELRDRLRRSNSFDELLEIHKHVLEYDAALTERAIGFR